MIEESPAPPTGSCARIVASLFGMVFLIALLAVPVVTTESRLREDPVTKIVTRTTLPRKTTMFLPRLLASETRGPHRTVHVRTTQWVATVGIVAFLGLLDYGLFCRLLRCSRPARPAQIPPS